MSWCSNYYQRVFDYETCFSAGEANQGCIIVPEVWFPLDPKLKSIDRS